MDAKKSWLDKLPAGVRHILLMFFAAFLGTVLKAVIVAQGVTTVKWHSVLESALNTSVAGSAALALALYITPLTRQYGMKKQE